MQTHRYNYLDLPIHYQMPTSKVLYLHLEYFRWHLYDLLAYHKDQSIHPSPHLTLIHKQQHNSKRHRLDR